MSHLELPIYQVDAFTSRCFGGNPAAICVVAEGSGWPEAELMQAVAEENNLAETAFCTKATQQQIDEIIFSQSQRERTLSVDSAASCSTASYSSSSVSSSSSSSGSSAATVTSDHLSPSSTFPLYLLRWFTPEIEMDLCGHATLAASHVVLTELEEDGVEGVRFYSEFSGELVVTKVAEEETGKPCRYRMLLPRRPPSPVDHKDIPRDILEGMGGMPQEVLKARDYVLVYESEAEILDLRPDPTILNRITDLDPGGICATAHASPQSRTERGVDFVSRFFTPNCSVFEDPVTGSAHCSLVPYWSARIKRKRLRAEQLSRRLGSLECEDLPEEDRVSVAGSAVTYMKGTIRIPNLI